MRYIFAFAFVSFFGINALAESGSFVVSAHSPWGTVFTNPSSAPMQISFYAAGRWGYASGMETDANGDGNAQCYLIGYCPMGGAGSGALLYRQGANVGYAGEYVSLSLAGNETVFFLNNDAEGAYADNFGKLTVRWQCSVGCH